MRWFRVDRIQRLEILNTKFIRDRTFNTQEPLGRIFQAEVGGGKPVEVEIWFDPPTATYIWERRWHPTQEIGQHPDGSIILRMSVTGLNEIKRWVLGYGKGASVKNPPELMELVQNEVEGMSQC